MLWIVSKTRSSYILLIFLLVCAARQGLAQNNLAIVHSPSTCFPTNRFPVIRAAIQSDSEVQSARVYFHSDVYPDIYFIEMTITENGFEAVLPLPAAETRHVIYYIEAVDAAFNTARTVEHDPSIDDQCREDPGALFPGQNPGIIIGALEAGAAAIPPGFQAAGIAGLATAAGGGIGAATAVLAAAGAAGAAGAAVVAGGNDKTTTTTTVPTPAPGTTTIPAGTTTTVGTTTSVGPASTTTTSPATPTTSVPGTTTTTVPIPEACFETKHLNFCRVKFDAQCSVGEITAYLWEIDTEGLVGGPFLKIIPAEVYVHDFEVCAGETIQTKLTVTDLEGRYDEITRSVTLPNSSSPPGTKSHSAAPVSVSVSSQLAVRPTDQTVRGFVVFNGSQRDPVEGSAEIRHIVTGREGENQIEAHVASELYGEVFWRFDFSGSEFFLPGTIQVVEGQVSSRSGYTVIFRLRGEPGETIRFAFSLVNRSR